METVKRESYFAQQFTLRLLMDFHFLKMLEILGQLKGTTSSLRNIFKIPVKLAYGKEGETQCSSIISESV